MKIILLTTFFLISFEVFGQKIGYFEGGLTKDPISTSKLKDYINQKAYNWCKTTGQGNCVTAYPMHWYLEGYVTNGKFGNCIAYVWLSDSLSNPDYPTLRKFKMAVDGKFCSSLNISSGNISYKNPFQLFDQEYCAEAGKKFNCRPGSQFIPLN